MAYHVTLKAEAIRSIELADRYSRTQEVGLRMTEDQLADAVIALAGELTAPKWDALKEQLDKEFAT